MKGTIPDDVSKDIMRFHAIRFGNALGVECIIPVVLIQVCISAALVGWVEFHEYDMMSIRLELGTHEHGETTYPSKSLYSVISPQTLGLRR